MDGNILDVIPAGIGGFWSQPSGSPHAVPEGGQLYQGVTWSGRQLVGPTTSELARILEERAKLATHLGALQALAQRFGGTAFSQYYDLARQLEQLDEQIHET